MKVNGDGGGGEAGGGCYQIERGLSLGGKLKHHGGVFGLSLFEDNLGSNISSPNSKAKAKETS